MLRCCMCAVDARLSSRPLVSLIATYLKARIPTKHPEATPVQIYRLDAEKKII